MTPERLDEIEARTPAATPKPWVLSHDEEFGEYEIRMASALPDEDGDTPASCRVQHIIHWDNSLYPEDGEQYTEAQATAAFIVASPTDVPDLVAEVRRLRTALDRATIALDDTLTAALDGELGEFERRVLDAGSLRELVRECGVALNGEAPA